MATNYIQPQPNMLGKFTEGLQAGQALTSVRQGREAEEAAIKAKGEADALKAQYSADLQDAFKNPTPDKMAMLTAKYPGQKDAFKQSWDLLNSDQQKNEILQTGQVYNALLSGKTEIAKDILNENILANENSGKDVTKLKSLLNYIDKDPNGAAGYAGLILSSVMGEKDFAGTFKAIGEEKRAGEIQPGKVSEQEAKAESAAVASKFAEQEAVLDIQKKGWDIKKIQNDVEVSKQNTKIAAINASLSKETNDLRREELRQKLEDAQQKRETTILEKTAATESGLASIDNMLNSMTKIIKTPLDIVESAAGPISSRVPTLSQDTADFEELVQTLSSQAFMAQIPGLKGMGALSNAEGEKLTASLQNFSLRQSPTQLVSNVNTAMEIIKKARENLIKKSGAPSTQKQESPLSIDDLLLKYGAN